MCVCEFVCVRGNEVFAFCCCWCICYYYVISNALTTNAVKRWGGCFCFLSLLFRFVVVFIIINSRIFALKQRLVMHKERERGRRVRAVGREFVQWQSAAFVVAHSLARLAKTPLSHSPLLFSLSLPLQPWQGVDFQLTLTHTHTRTLTCTQTLHNCMACWLLRCHCRRRCCCCSCSCCCRSCSCSSLCRVFNMQSIAVAVAVTLVVVLVVAVGNAKLYTATKLSCRLRRRRRRLIGIMI